MRQLKKLLGNNAHWTINKELAKDLGLNATILLQHFIDLQYNYFEDGGFYQQQKRLLDDLPLTSYHLREATKVLVEKGFLTVIKKGLPAKNHYTVNEGNVLTYLSSITSDSPCERLEDKPVEHKHKKTKETKKQDNTNKKYKKVMDKLIERYPKNRVNSTGPILKYLQKKTDTELKQIILAVPKYLELAGDYVKNLRNYLEHECWTEEWLQAETKKKKPNKNELTGQKTFKGDYGNI